MSWDDDDDDWPPPERDPEALEHTRRTLRGTFGLRQRALRWAYGIIGLIVIAIVVIAVTR
jgi:hypothetical protein